jgi:hypothetical protein
MQESTRFRASASKWDQSVVGSVTKLKAAVAQTISYDIGLLEIVIADSLPITPTGKISKAELAKQAGTLQQAGRPSGAAGGSRT